MVLQKMNKFIFILLLIYLTKGQEDIYKALITEKVSEEYVQTVIDNLISIVEKVYVYSDFLKSPIQPEGHDGYIPKVDLVEELKKIKTNVTTFYEFYRQLLGVINKARDGHFSLYTSQTPSNLKFHSLFFCSPFIYYPLEMDQDDGTKTVEYLFIASEHCKNLTSEETRNKIADYSGKTIVKVNDLPITEYFEKFGKIFNSVHSPQGRYVNLMRNIAILPLSHFPFLKEELNLKIEFEEGEILETSYQLLSAKDIPDPEFQQFLEQEIDKYFQNKIPYQTYEEIEHKFKIQKGLLTKDNLKEDYNWDLLSKDGSLKCKVDTDEQMNILYQKTFAPSDFDDYENTMYECFSKFYSNDYKLIIIEDKNGGGYSELCVPFSRYVNPKNERVYRYGMKDTNMTRKNFVLNDENLDMETCRTITDGNDIAGGETIIYPDNVVHKKTKDVEIFNIFEKKVMDKKRREYLKTGKVKKPTEIIIFTDGFSFSCTSLFIKSIQEQGGGILVGYHTRPDLSKTKYDASQSNSAVHDFKFSEETKTLSSLGYGMRVTFTETFDRNDKDSVKVPMEYKIYPVDEVSDIYIEYNDLFISWFINESKRIFNKYNNLEEGKCNPDNIYLYYETADCDAKINIEHAHGGYLCNSEGKWDKTKCIAAYCDDGYFLNNERTKCLPSPCDKIQLQEISIKDTNGNKTGKEYIIDTNTAYIFKIEGDSTYTFNCELDNFFFMFDGDHILKPVPKSTSFKKFDKIYVNYYLNNTKNVSIFVKNENDDDDDDDGKDSDDGKHDSDDSDSKKDSTQMATSTKVLIAISSVVALAIILLIIFYFIKRSKKNVSLESEVGDIGDKNQEWN